MGRGEKWHFASTGESKLKKRGNVQTKGRNPELVDSRNMALIHRYYYWSAIQKLKYEDVLLMLATDFFIHPETIGKYLQRDSAKVQEVRRAALTVKKLAAMFPQFTFKQPDEPTDKRQTIIVGNLFK